VMPDKIVKKVVNEILVRAGLEPVDDNLLPSMTSKTLPNYTRWLTNHFIT